MATDLIDLAGHEQVAFCSDPDTGLRAIIALHDTALGPGPRRHALPPLLLDRPGARRRAAPLARHDEQERRRRPRPRRRQGGHHRRPAPRQDPELLRAYGRFVESLGGRYVTACDVGTYVADMDVVGEATRWATGRSPERGGAGRLLGAHGLRRLPGHARGRPARVGRADPGRPPGRRSPASARWAAGSPSTSSRTAPRWSSPTSTRMPCARSCAPHPRVARRRRRRRPGARPSSTCSAPTPSAAPSTTQTVEALRARVVCGGANNQLVSEGEGGTADRLRERGITYAPDFLVNAGGVIQVSDELHGFDMRPGPRAHRDDLRAHPRGAARRRRGGGQPGRGRRPARRAADRRGRATALAARRPGRLGGPAEARSANTGHA